MIVNTVLITGTLLSNPEIQLDNFGCPFLILRLISRLPYIDPFGERREKDNFFCVAARDELATECNALKEGEDIFVEGRLISHEWEEGGATITSMKVQAESVQRR